jgi:hypothetical protein
MGRFKKAIDKDKYIMLLDVLMPLYRDLVTRVQSIGIWPSHDALERYKASYHGIVIDARCIDIMALARCFRTF